jgi:hypothetical protein
MKLSWIDPAPARLTLDHETIWPAVFAAALAGARLLPSLEALPALSSLAAVPLPFPRTCLFHAVTGMPCPGCGGTRALTAFAQLDLAAAFAWNPLIALVGVAASGFTVYALVATALRTRRFRLVGLSDVERIGAVCLVLGNWAYLIAVGR